MPENRDVYLSSRLYVVWSHAMGIHEQLSNITYSWTCRAYNSALLTKSDLRLVIKQGSEDSFY